MNSEKNLNEDRDGGSALNEPLEAVTALKQKIRMRILKSAQFYENNPSIFGDRVSILRDLAKEIEGI